MKALSIYLMLMLSSLSFADTTMSEGVWFDGTQKSDTVKLTTDKTKIESRTVMVPSICTRTENRRQCGWQHGRCRNVCRSRNNCTRVCSPGRQVCRNIPVQVNYPCDRAVVQEFEVLDYHVNTSVTLDYNIEDILGGAGEEFVVSVTGKDMTLSVQDSKEYVVLKEQADASANRNGQVLEQNFKYKIDFVPAKKITDVFDHGIKNVSLANGILTFSLSNNFNTEDFIQNLKVLKARRLARNIVLFDKDLTDADMDVSVYGDSKLIIVDLNKFGVKQARRTKIVLTTKFNPKGYEVLNKDSFELEASEDWVFKR